MHKVHGSNSAHTVPSTIKTQGFTLYATGFAKSHNIVKYCIVTFKIELRRKFASIYPFFITHSIRLFHIIRTNSKLIKNMAKTLGTIYLMQAASPAAPRVG